MNKKRQKVVDAIKDKQIEEEKLEELQEEEKTKCVNCMEELNPAEYMTNPYGIICEVNQTKLFYHS